MYAAAGMSGDRGKENHNRVWNRRVCDLWDEEKSGLKSTSYYALFSNLLALQLSFRSKHSAQRPVLKHPHA